MNPFRVIIPTTKAAGAATARTISVRIQRAKLVLEEIESSVNRIYVSGRLDVLGVHQIESEFAEMTAGKKKSLIVDMCQVELLSSVGLGLLISNSNSLHSCGKMMVLFKPNPRVERVLRMACLDQLLPIEYDLSRALNRIKSSEVS